jgi:hypothetical protein
LLKSRSLLPRGEESNKPSGGMFSWSITHRRRGLITAFIRKFAFDM